MKNIYKIKLLLVVLFVFNSCAIDDDEPVKNIVGETVISLASTIERVPTSTATYDVVVNLSSALPYTSRLTYTLDGVEMFADIDPNTTSATIPVDMSSSDVRVVTLSSVVTLYATAAGYSSSVSSTSNTTAIAKEGVGENGDLYAQLTWSSDDDIDLMMTEAPAPTPPYEIASLADVVAYSGTTSALESFTVSSAQAEGTYAISIIPYDSFSSTVNFSLTVVDGSNVHSITGSADSAAAAGGFFSIIYNTIIEAAHVEKVGTGTSSTYTVEGRL